ncbi:deoxyxylulose-5-phosphate synthase [Streptomyces sp. NBC_01304]|uniref:deoxyxylulose-5-phosphate synthase n=1 Tax=Streptomyces sp. NBC_01304 TaxID=2903818 RepID=UPI002E0F770E|nr:deoxyxylulose-5-phosphate synthase [Streptomyces sp. NBC_01304]
MANSRFVCLPCRAGYKKSRDHLRVRGHVCPRCGGELIDAGTGLAVPKHRDIAGWRALTAVLNAGIRFRQSCCGGPGYRPRTPREVRERLSYAAELGIPVTRALRCYDLTRTDIRRQAGRGEFGRRSAATRRARGRGL